MPTLAHDPREMKPECRGVMRVPSSTSETTARKNGTRAAGERWSPRWPGR